MIRRYNVNNFDYNIISQFDYLKKPRGRQYTKDEKKILNVTCAFDIETTGLEKLEQSFMYIWQLAIGTDIVIIGRYWHEFIKLLEKLSEILEDYVYMIIYVHNLSYEFTFLKGIYEFSNEDIFALDRRKVAKCTMYKHFEFRCSYIQTNMSLKEFTHKYNVEHKKLEDFIYTKKRYPWTKLSKKELDYAINDVVGLVEAINEEMRLDNDTLWTIPLTSTGYIRRMAKRSMYGYNHRQLKAMLPDFEIYTMLAEAFRGGNTHANRYMADTIIHNVSSADRSSSYPDCQVNDKYPMSEFYLHTRKLDVDEVLDLIYKHHKAVLIRICFHDLELLDKLWGCPYLSRDKCRHVINGLYDNGRILEADYLETTLTDIDLKIVLAQYTFSSCDILKCADARYGYLPNQIRNLNIELYKKKTELKGIKEQEIYYMKSKNLLNSIYGMTVQRPVREPIIFTNNMFELDTSADPEELLEKYYRKAFLSYAWGVWTTAHARYRLEEGIRLAGHNFVYCDTDSVKYIGDIDWTAYNRERIRISKANGAYAKDAKGNMHYMGVFEAEEFMPRFKTLGAKKYCYEDEDKHLHLTLAGVSKKLGAEELEARGGLEAFKDNFIFVKAGGNEAIYNDNVNKSIKINNKEIIITDNLYLKPSTYTLGMTEEYIRLLEDSELWLEIMEKEAL